MALKQGSERYTMWTHVENGKVLSRRLHRIEVQARDGRLHVIEGDKLPDFLQTCAGVGYQGLHLAQILLKPGPIKLPLLSEEPRLWPTGRDTMNMALGFVGFILARFLFSLVHGDF
jgi:hypothetical protein